MDTESKKTVQILDAYGIGRSLSPISHSTPRDEFARKDNVLRFRRVAVNVSTEDGIKTIPIPAISGNSIRGQARLLLFRETHQALGLDKFFTSLFNDQKTARQVAYLFAKGGMTPGNITPNPATIGQYQQIRRRIPMLSLLGGAYYAHHFLGDLQCHNMYPICRETLLAGLVPEDAGYVQENVAEVSELQAWADGAEDKGLIQRFTKMEDADFGIQQQNEEPLDTETDEEDENTGEAEAETQEKTKTKAGTRSIFVIEVLPANTPLVHTMRCITDNEGSILAFKALAYLIARYGKVGGNIGRGFGHVSLSYKCDGQEINQQDLQNYRDYLAQNKDDIIDAIKAIPSTFTYAQTKKQSKEGAHK